MPSSYSPLRYPGGKAQLYNYVLKVLESNDLTGKTYFEPFAGGAGLALRLLFSNKVKRIIINDLDPAIYAIWNCILNNTEEFCNKIQNVEISVAEWDRQKHIYEHSMFPDINLAFSTFFLNRTNRSGVIKGGIIGGRAQDGLYAIDARFNKQALITKIRAIAAKKDQIVLTNKDARELIDSDFLQKYRNVFIYFDPPYVIKGSQLYKNSFTEQDHINLYKSISKCKRKWIVTYDVCNFIEDLYSKYRGTYIELNYSVSTNTKANEAIYFSKNLIMPK